MNKQKRELALALWRCGAVMDKSRSPEGKGFRLKLHETKPDASLSPIYLNLRIPPKGTLTQEIVDLAAELMFDALTATGVSFNALAGIPEAGDPFAAMVHHCCEDRTRLLVLRKEQTTGRRQIAGIKGEHRDFFGKRSVLVDDLITRAHSKIEAIEVMESVGAPVVAIVILVDREQGGTEELHKGGHKVISVFTISELLDFYLDEKLMLPAIYDEIKAYLASS